jgi:hypothetical protein
MRRRAAGDRAGRTVAPARVQPRIGCTCIAAQLVALAVCAWSPQKATATELLGQAGVLGEWELTAELAESSSATAKEFSGPLLMKHVGICTQDGPEERAGEIQISLGPSESRVTAKLIVDGVACSYIGQKAHAYEGMMSCAGRAPVPLLLWLK